MASVSFVRVVGGDGRPAFVVRGRGGRELGILCPAPDGAGWDAYARVGAWGARPAGRAAGREDALALLLTGGGRPENRPA